jgi:hypothetical protein
MKTLKIALGVLFVCGGLLIFSMSALEEYYYRNRPRQPDPQSGRIYPQHVKSFSGVSTVYVTRSEEMPFEVVQYANPIICVLGIVTGTLYVICKRKKMKRG